MTVETAPFINGLNSSYPTGATSRGEADDHLRLIKSAVKATFPNITGAVTVTHTELNKLAGLAETVADKLQQFSLSISEHTTRISAIETNISALSLSISALVATLSVVESTYFKARSLTVVTSARTIGTEYTNSATYPIWIHAIINIASGNRNAKAVVASQTIAHVTSQPSWGTTNCLSFPVGPGETYRITGIDPSDLTIINWVERA